VSSAVFSEPSPKDWHNKSPVPAIAADVMILVRRGWESSFDAYHRRSALFCILCAELIYYDGVARLAPRENWKKVDSISRVVGDGKWQCSTLAIFDVSLMQYSISGT
jgi:hypothetical protein